MLHTLYVDMNSYFASVEQQLHPELRGRPIAVVPMEVDTTSVIAASYEAKKFGVKTGVKVGDARRMCPGLVLVTGKHDEYIRFHHKVIAAIDTVLPVERVCSIDEVSCRLMGRERETAEAVDRARRVKKAILNRCGSEMRCSVGIAPSRFIAKIAADMQKPDGLTVIEKHELPARLFGLNLIDLPGIGQKMLSRLERAGVHTVEQLCAADERALGRAWGSVIGREWHFRLRGEILHDTGTSRRTIGHSHVLSPERRSEEKARAVGVRLVTKVGTRTRHLGYSADHLTLSIRFLSSPAERSAGLSTPRWHARAPLGGACDTTTLLHALTSLWDAMPRRGPILQIGVTLHDLTPTAGLTPLFAGQDEQTRLSKAMDAINRKYGADSVYPASMHDARSSAPRRIAFGNIPDLDVPDVEN